MVIQKMSELGMEDSSMTVHELTGSDLDAIGEGDSSSVVTTTTTVVSSQQQHQHPLYENTTLSTEDNNANANRDRENNSIPVRFFLRR